MNIRWRRLSSIYGTQDALAPIGPPSARRRTRWTVDPSTESWWYAPPSTPEGFHEVQVRQQDGYDFASHAMYELRLIKICHAFHVPGDETTPDSGSPALQRSRRATPSPSRPPRPSAGLPRLRRG